MLSTNVEYEDCQSSQRGLRMIRGKRWTVWISRERSRGQLPSAGNSGSFPNSMYICKRIIAFKGELESFVDRNRRAKQGNQRTRCKLFEKSEICGSSIRFAVLFFIIKPSTILRGPLRTRSSIAFRSLTTCTGFFDFKIFKNFYLYIPARATHSAFLQLLAFSTAFSARTAWICLDKYIFQCPRKDVMADVGAWSNMQRRS